LSPSSSESPSPSFEEPVFYRNHNIIFNNVANPQVSLRNSNGEIPCWNITGRPKKLKPYTIGFNLQTHHLELFDGSRWIFIPMEKV